MLAYLSLGLFVVLETFGCPSFGNDTQPVPDAGEVDAGVEDAGQSDAGV